jgi:hypothetical protein
MNAISQWKDGMQKSLSDDMKHALGTGINDPAGLGGMLADGKLFTNTLDKTTYDIEKSLEEVVKRRMINNILKEKVSFLYMFIGQVYIALSLISEILLNICLNSESFCDCQQCKSKDCLN